MSKARSKSTNILAAKEVPDFEKLYEKFVSTLERSKGARFTTVPVPFSFDGREPTAKKTDEDLEKVQGKPYNLLMTQCRSSAPIEYWLGLGISLTGFLGKFDTPAM